jgi:hypothetical protein
MEGAYARIIVKSGFCYAILGFLLLISLILADSLHFGGILGIFGAQILGGGWR